jgi:hypothetical protein
LASFHPRSALSMKSLVSASPGVRGRCGSGQGRSTAPLPHLEATVPPGSQGADGTVAGQHAPDGAPRPQGLRSRSGTTPGNAASYTVACYKVVRYLSALPCSGDPSS